MEGDGTGTGTGTQQGQEGQQTPPVPPEGGPGGESGQQGGGGHADLTVDQLREKLATQDKTLEKLRGIEREYAKEKKAFDAAQTKLKEIDDQQKTELERERERADQAEARSTQLEADRRGRAVRYAVGMAAAKLNFHNPDDVHHFLTFSDEDFDEQGEPKGVEAKVKKLAEERPYLVVEPGKNGPPSSPNSDRREGQLTPEQDRLYREQQFALERGSF
jgi:hypothetical protein